MEKKQELQNEKAKKFQQLLEENKIESFTVSQIEDDSKSVVFRSRMEVAGQELPMIVVLDDSIYAMIRIQIVGGSVQEENYVSVSKKVNELNLQYKIFKYYITEQGGLCLDCCIPSTAEKFDGELVQTIIQVIIGHLTEAYPALMRCVWGDSAK